jgi:hypothetical protein
VGLGVNESAQHFFQSWSIQEKYGQQSTTLLALVLRP